MRFSGKSFLLILLCLVLAVASAGGEATPEPGRSLFRVHQINIGCGDAYLLTVDDIVILVDCGTDSTLPISEGLHNYPLFEYLEASGIDHVDVHFVTHWHNDHCYNVDTLMQMYGTEDTIVYGASKELLPELAPLPKGTYRHLIEGDHFSIGPLDVLCVGPAYRDNLTGTFNHDSLNFIITYGKIRYLFTGDYVERTVRSRWTEKVENIDVMSFPHHGLTPICITTWCMKLMNPRLVLVPGRASGPAQQFAKHEAHVQTYGVYLSAKDGHIIVTSDGTNIWYAVDVNPGEFPLGKELSPRPVRKEKP